MDDTKRMLSLQVSYKQDGEEKVKYQNTKQLKLILAILCLSTFYYGYCLTYLSTISSEIMKNVFGPDSQIPFVSGVLIGSLTVGAAFGSLISPFLMKILSRRNFVLIINLCALVVQAVIQFPNLYCLLICRIFQGIFIGNFMALVPIYINELCPKQIVGSFGVYTQLFQNIGVVSSYLLGLVLQQIGLNGNILWRIMFAANILTISTSIICIFLKIIPESPNSLISKNQIQKAKIVIGMFYKQQFIQQVLEQRIMEVQKQEKKTISKSNNNALVYDKKAYFVAFQLPFMHQMTGANAIVTQVGSIVKKYDPKLGFYTPLAINIVQLVGTISAITILKKVGRRTALLFGNFGLGVCDVLLGIVFIFISYKLSIGIVFFFMVIYMLIYGASLGPTAWLYVPQIIPAKTVPFATTVNWIAASLCIIGTPIINSALGVDYPVFFIFAGVTLSLLIVNYFLLVQTKGLSSEEICDKYAQEICDKFKE